MCVCVCVCGFSLLSCEGDSCPGEKRGHVSTASSSLHYSQEEDLIWFCGVHVLIGVHFLLLKRLLSEFTAETAWCAVFLFCFFLLRFHPIWITNHLDCLDWVRIASHLERTFNVICLRATGAGLGAVPCARGQVPLGKVLLVRISVCRSLCSEFSNPQVLPVLPCHFSPLLSNALSYASLCPSACPSLVSSTRPSQLFAPSPLIIAHTRRNSSFVWDN